MHLFVTSQKKVLANFFMLKLSRPLLVTNAAGNFISTQNSIKSTAPYHGVALLDDYLNFFVCLSSH